MPVAARLMPLLGRLYRSARIRAPSSGASREASLQCPGLEASSVLQMGKKNLFSERWGSVVRVRCAAKAVFLVSTRPHPLKPPFAIDLAYREPRWRTPTAPPRALASGVAAKITGSAPRPGLLGGCSARSTAGGGCCGCLATELALLRRCTVGAPNQKLPRPPGPPHAAVTSVALKRERRVAAPDEFPAAATADQVPPPPESTQRPTSPERYLAPGLQRARPLLQPCLSLVQLLAHADNTAATYAAFTGVPPPDYFSRVVQQPRARNTRRGAR